MAVRTSFARVGSWWYIDKRGKKNLGSVHGPTYLSRLLNFIRKIQSQLPQNWKRLERWEYNTSASKRSRKLTVSSKCIKAHGIVTEYIFSHSPVPQAPDLDRELTTLMFGISIILFKITLYKALGEHIGALPWTRHFDGSAFVKKCPGGIAPNRLKADGADCGSTKADRLYTIT